MRGNILECFVLNWCPLNECLPDRTVSLYLPLTAPIARGAKAPKMCAKFNFLGKFLARAVMDFRMVDIPLNRTFYKWMLGREDTLGMKDFAQVDADFARTLGRFHEVALQKQRLEEDPEHTANSRKLAVDNLTVDGASVEDFGFVFTLPGHDEIELKVRFKSPFPECLGHAGGLRAVRAMATHPSPGIGLGIGLGLDLGLAPREGGGRWVHAHQPGLTLSTLLSIQHWKGRWGNGGNGRLLQLHLRKWRSPSSNLNSPFPDASARHRGNSLLHGGVTSILNQRLLLQMTNSRQFW